VDSHGHLRGYFDGLNQNTASAVVEEITKLQNQNFLKTIAMKGSTLFCILVFAHSVLAAPSGDDSATKSYFARGMIEKNRAELAPSHNSSSGHSRLYDGNDDGF